jgi:hypothetical protein
MSFVHTSKHTLTHTYAEKIIFVASKGSWGCLPCPKGQERSPQLSLLLSRSTPGFTCYASVWHFGGKWIPSPLPFPVTKPLYDTIPDNNSGSFTILAFTKGACGHLKFCWSTNLNFKSLVPAWDLTGRFIYLFKRWDPTLLARLALNSWAQVILLPQPPQ